MQQFDVILKDFVNWKLDNDDIIDRFRSIDSKVYRRLEPVIAVLNYTYQRAIHQGPLNEDLETIFQVGLNYLNDQFSVIKEYYMTLFNQSCEAFEEFGDLVNYLLFIHDFRSDIEKYKNAIEMDDIDELETCIEDMIAQKDKDIEYAEKRFNQIVNHVVSVLDYEYTSIVDIYYEIARTMGIGLSDDAMSIIGKEW